MVRPIGITADRHRALLSIQWNDGHRTDYPFTVLSAACPCANCNEEREQLVEQGKNPVTDYIPKSDQLSAVVPVGTYAINIVWKDGCRYGIYTWDLLLELESRNPQWRS